MKDNNSIHKMVSSIKDKYEDKLTNLRYSLLKKPENNDDVVALLELMNTVSDDVIRCMEKACAVDEPAKRFEYLEMIEETLPEYFNFLEEVDQKFERNSFDPPRKRDK